MLTDPFLTTRFLAEYTEMVNQLQEAFEKATKKYFEQNSSDEEELNQEYPDLNLKTSAFREKQIVPATNAGTTTNSTGTTSIPATNSSNNNSKGPKPGAIKEGSGVAKSKSSNSADSGDSAKKKKRTLEVPPTKKKKKKKSREEDESDINASSADEKEESKGSSAKTIAAASSDEEEVKRKIKMDADPDQSIGNSESESKKKHKRKGAKGVVIASATATVKTKKDNNKSNKHSKKEAKKRANSSKKVKEEEENDEANGAPSEDEVVVQVNGAKVKEEEEEEASRVSQKGVKRKRKDKEKKRKKKKQDVAEEVSDAEESPMRGGDDSELDVDEPEEEDEENEDHSRSKKHKSKKTALEKKSKSTKKEKHGKEVPSSKHHHHHHHHRSKDGKEADKDSTCKSKSSTNPAASHSKGKHKSKANTFAERVKGSGDEYSFTEDEPEEEPVSDGEEEKVEPTPVPVKKHKKTHGGEESKATGSRAKNKKSDSLEESSKTTSVSKKKKEKSKVSSLSSKSSKSASKMSSKGVQRSGGGDIKPIDRMSVSSHDEHDASPIDGSSFERRDMDDTLDSLHSNENRTLSRPITPDIKDKYDLIKQRRRNAGKGSQSMDSPSSNSVERTPKKGKEKKVSSKHRSVSEDDDAEEEEVEEKGQDKASALFDRLREDDLKSSFKRPEKGAKNQDEYDFVDDNPSAESAAKGVAQGKPNSTNNGVKEKTSKKGQPKEPPVKPPVKSAAPSSGTKKTNLEALELETEQTLKDINRWLEHTPRFPDYSSASNSPSRYMLEEFDTMDPNAFRRPAPAGGNSAVPSSSGNKPGGPKAAADDAKKGKDNRPGGMGAPGVPGPVGPRKEAVKDKRKSLKDKIYNRKKEPSRTIDRLQPGKAKGNLLNSIQNINKPEELFPLGNLVKLKEVKNSLVVNADESGPKLSLGSVLDADRFGLMQQHNFTEDKENDDTKLLGDDVKSPVAAPSETTEPIEMARVPPVEPAKSDSEPAKSGDDKATPAPNHSAWFKAFGAPKVTKPDEESRKSDDNKMELEPKSPAHKDKDHFHTRPAAPRMRKASTGSTISERSSYSQDPDSPRVGMDERLGYGANQYTTSPLGLSPTSLTSPKPDDLIKVGNYNLNGAIKVGFYQDTTQKSSPEKSCSPREIPTPTYPQYSQPVYSATHAYANYYNTTSPVGTSSSNGAAAGPTASGTTNAASPTAAVAMMENNSSSNSSSSNKAAAAPVNPVSFYDNYNKQPRSQESDYNSSMSPNPNSPYQQQHNSPYHQQQHSPYQQHSPAAQPAAQNMQPTSPYSQSNQSSPFSQQDTNSPYPRPDQMSPYHHPNSPSQPQIVPSVQQQQVAKGSGIEGWSPASAAAAAASVGSGGPAAVPSTPSQPAAISMQGASYEAPRQQQQQEQQSSGEINKIPQAHNNNSNNLSNKISPPMAHASNNSSAATQHHVGQHIQSQQQTQGYSQMDGHNIQPAHQNYPMYPPSLSAPLHSKPYEDPQSLLMSHNLHSSHHHHHQGMYSAPNQVPAHGKASDSTTTQHQQQSQQQQQQNQHQNMFDLIALRKGPFGNISNISTSKAFEMFNRAATMAFPKTSDPKEVYDMNSYNKTSAYGNTFDMLKGASGSSHSELLNLGHPKASAGGEQVQQHQQQHGQGPSPQSQSQQSGANTTQQHHQPAPAHNTQQQQQHHHQAHQYGAAAAAAASASRRAADLVIPNPRSGSSASAAAAVTDQNKSSVDQLQHQQTQQHHQTHQQQQQHVQQRYDYMAQQMASYRSSPFGGASQQHLSSMGLDERLMGMPQHAGTTGYYDKTMAQNMFAKQSAMTYGGYENKEGNAGVSTAATAAPAAAVAAPQTKAKKGSGRGKKSKTATPPTETPTAPITYQGNAMPGASHLQMNQHSQLQGHGHQMGQQSSTGASVATHGQQTQNLHLAQQQQGFQSYSNLKTAIAAASTTASGGSSGSSATDATAISLKTASMMPASAFNFGPTSTGLGLYGETTGYLDDFRNPANHYYLPPAAQQATDKGTVNAGNGANASAGGAGGSAASANSSSAAAVAAATQSAAAYHQFLSHQPSRPAYPFMNSQLDPNSPIYQQYFQRRQDEIRAQMMLNQGLLHPGAPPGAYGQPGYHHPSLGMHKPPYDAINRPSWL